MYLGLDLLLNLLTIFTSIVCAIWSQCKGWYKHLERQTPRPLHSTHVVIGPLACDYVTSCRLRPLSQCWTHMPWKEMGKITDFWIHDRQHPSKKWSDRDYTAPGSIPVLRESWFVWRKVPALAHHHELERFGYLLLRLFWENWTQLMEYIVALKLSKANYNSQPIRLNHSLDNLILHTLQ